jgi:two-component system, cell cycle response regulator DivK
MKRKSAPVPKAKKKILIIDDDADIISLLRTVLTEADYEVMEASYSLPAMFQVVRKRPDLILMDINMPGMNGFELMEQFKTYEETRNVPIVAITGMDTNEAREIAKGVGCVGFIPKPFDIKRFPGQIAKFLSA